MATLTEPAPGETSGALFRALRSVGVDADLAYLADDEMRTHAGQNVITVLNARFDELSAKIEALSTDIDTKIDAVNSRIDTLQRVIWPLVVLLASTVFGLLYRMLTS